MLIVTIRQSYRDRSKKLQLVQLWSRASKLDLDEPLEHTCNCYCANVLVTFWEREQHKSEQALFPQQVIVPARGV